MINLLAIYHLIDAGADRPNIGLVIVLIAAKDLGCHVEGRSQHGGSVVFSVEEFGEAKVSNFDIVVMEQDVGKLEIAMHDFMFNEGLEASENLAKIPDNRMLIDTFKLFDFAEHVTAITVLKNEIVVVGGFFEGIEFHDVGIVASFEDFNFVFEQLIEFALDSLALDSFDSNWQIGFLVEALVDVAELA